MKPVLKVENISKLYRLGEVGTGTISHDLNRWWHKLRGKEDPYQMVGQTNDRTQKSTNNYVWALKDINFEVNAGEVLGIIGRNGAGKSTLLKIISQITSPTSGSIKAKGRIASLLEVGTGMNPELTARENIYLNGAILGMRKYEIDRKFDEIIDFSGCQLYVDTPIKRFSSGMRVRLGFAVAAFLEPEILIVDEVLAVGDAEFQKKAIGKMQDVSKGEGRTVLFVSHDMGAVKSLCNMGILLKDGQIELIEITEFVVNEYLKSSLKLHQFNNIDDNNRPRVLSVKTINNSLIETSEFISGEQMKLEISLQYNFSEVPFPLLNVIIKNTNNSAVLMFRSDEMGVSFKNKYIYLSIPELLLRPGKYFVQIVFANNNFENENIIDNIENSLSFEVLTTDFYNSSKFIKSGGFGLLKAIYHE